jgi:hypothetical protein
MKRAALLCVVLIHAIVSVAAADFRSSSWGLSETAVKERESARLHSESRPADGLKALVFNDSIAGLDVFVIYLLHQDRLVQTKYVFPQAHMQTARFLDDYARVNRLLREENGPPAESGEFWRNGAFREKLDRGQQVAVGELMMMSRWETAETDIVHVLRGERMNISHEIHFISNASDMFK